MRDETVIQALLYKHFGGRTDRRERRLLAGWLRESEENRTRYRRESELYEAYLLTAPLEQLEAAERSRAVGAGKDARRAQGLGSAARTGGAARLGSLGDAARTGETGSSSMAGSPVRSAMTGETGSSSMTGSPVRSSWTDGPRRSSRARKALRIFALAGANAAAIAVIALIAFRTVPAVLTERLSAAVTSIAARPGQQLDLTLSDGTAVKLNSGAEISFPNLFIGGHRTVSLRGEAWFEVARQPDKPFIVRTFASDIEVLGTKFNVSADEERRQFTAILTEGLIRLKSGTAPELLLHPGEKVTIRDGRIEKADSYSPLELGWRQGLVDISKVSFEELMHRFERAFGVQILIDRAEPPKLECSSGEVRISDGIGYALDLLRHFADFTYVKDRESGVIHIE